MLSRAAKAVACLLIASGGCMLAPSASAYTCQSNASGSWTAPATWVNCGGGTPVAGDDVQIGLAHVVTIPADTAVAAASVVFTASSGAAALTHGNSGSRITIGSGGLTIYGSGANATRAWNIDAGSAIVNGSVTLVEGTNNARVARVNITSGSLAVYGATGTDGHLVMSNASNSVRTVVAVSGAGSITLTGSFTMTGALGTLTSAAGSTFTYASASAASVATGSTIGYAHLVIDKPGGQAATLDAPGAPRDFIVAGNLTVRAGTLGVGNVTAAISGTTTVAGTLAITGADGTKSFAGELAINGGTWRNTANEDVSLSGGISNNGAFSSGAGVYSFAASQSLSGNPLFFDGNVKVLSGVILTNTVATTVNGDFLGGGGGGAATGTLVNATNSRLSVGGNMAGLSTLDASAPDNTVEYIGGAVRTAKFSAYHHLAVNSTGTVTLAGDTTIAGDLTTNGYFDPSANSRLVTFSGTAPQRVVATGGAANITFYNLTLSNTTASVADRTLTLGMNVTVNNILQLASGRVVTGTGPSPCTSWFRLILPASGVISGAAGAPDNRFVAGRLDKFVNNGNPTVTFEIGTTGATEPQLGYSPVTMAFSFVAGLGGNLTVCPTFGDHPQLPASQLDETKSVNRYWTLSVSGGPGDLGAFTADTTFTFVNLSASITDVDAGADTELFEAQRWDGAAWTDAVAGARTPTTTQVLNVTTLGDFAVAERKGGGTPVGGFNALDTPTCAVMGVIRTKVSGAPIAVNIVALQSPPTAIRTNFNGTVRVEIVDSSGGACADSPVIQLLPDLTFSTGDGGCKPTPAFAIPNSWANARVRVSYNLGKPSEMIACSGDNFAIRPHALVNVAVTDGGAWDVAGTARALGDTSFGTVIHKAGRPVSVRAQAVNAAASPLVTTNYAGAPAATLSTCVGAACTATQGVLTLNTTFAAGQLVTDAASYAEVGSFALELRDSAFANVDQYDGTPADCTALGRHVCQQGGPIPVGRFVPDHFAVAYNTPSFATACAAGAHTYLGQSFGYALAPQITVTARNAASGTTALYAGSHWRITDAVLAASGNRTYAAASGTLDTTGAPAPDPVIVPGAAGVGTLSFSSGTGFRFQRTSPVAPFSAEISLALNVVDADGVAYAGNPARFGAATPGNGMAFTSGKEMRFGRLMLGSANGSQLLPLRLALETQYWTGASFVTNTADSCTALAASHIGYSNYTQNLSDVPACETSTLLGGAFAGGRGSLKLSAPGHGNNGGVDVTVNLAGAASGTTCLAVGAPPGAPTLAGKPYLQTGTGSAYTQNPKGRARFGVYRATEDYIDMRELFQ